MIPSRSVGTRSVWTDRIATITDFSAFWNVAAEAPVLAQAAAGAAACNDLGISARYSLNEARAGIRVAIAWGYLGEEEAVEATAAIDKLGRRNLGLSLR